MIAYPCAGSTASTARMSESRFPLSSSFTRPTLYLASLGVKRRRDVLGGSGELSLVARLEHDLDARPSRPERRVRADEQAGEALPSLDEDAYELALARVVRAPPRADRRRTGEARLDRREHRLHLGGESRQDVGVLDHEARSAAQRVLDRFASHRERSPPRRVLGVVREPAAQRVGELRNDLLP